jgi:hypothetical protein
MHNVMTSVFVSCSRLLCRGFSLSPGASEGEVETSPAELAGAGWGAGERAGLASAALRLTYDRVGTTDAARCAPQWG